MPTLNDVLAGSLAQAVQVQQIIDALKGTPNKGVPVALVALNDSTNYALTVQNDDPTNSRALLVLKADGSTLIAADATGVTLGAPVNLPSGSVNGSTALANGSVTNAKLASDVTAKTNMMTNGGLEVWQRGNGPFTANGAYAADRWVLAVAGGDTLSVSRDTTNNDIGSTVCLAATYTRVGGGSSLFQDVKEAQLRGKTVSLSVRVRTATASAVQLQLTGDGTSPPSVTSSFHTGSGSYQTLTASGYAVPSDATYVRIYVVLSASCTAYIDNAMLVVGSVAADYAPLHPADDLARCQRYYEVIGPNSTNSIIVSGIATASAQALRLALRWTRKAVTPTVTKVGTWTVSGGVSQPTANSPDVDSCYLQITSGAAGDNFAYNSAGCFITVEANP